MEAERDMKSRLCSMLALTIVATGSFVPVKAKEPLRLSSSSKWHVDYGPDHCRLARQFGVGDQTVIAIFDKFGPGEGFRMTVAGKPVRTNTPKDEAWVQFGPAEAPQQLPFLRGNVGTDTALLFVSSERIAPPSDAELLAIKNKEHGEWIDLAPIASSRYEAVRHMEIGKPLRQPVILETGSLRKPIETLDKCVDDLLTRWGIDVEKHKTRKQAPVPTENPGRWILSYDYPLDMLNAGQPALVEFRLNVGTDGKPTGCHIQATTRPKEFDDAVCKSLMRRAEFQPALDADGKPLASYWRSRVRFELPGM
jgi:Gram-negative bacterial TonB protein C-terminal